METLSIKHTIQKIKDLENGGNYRIFIRIPLEYGWIERVNVYFFTFEKRSIYNLKHQGNSDKYAFFSLTLELETQAVYHYYFSFEANGIFQYYKKENITGNTSLTTYECWKLSVGFYVPNWAKGAVMYHIFVDRYRKGKDTKMEPMPNRKIHENWNEMPIIGPDENGLWNVDFFGGNLKGIEESLDYIKNLGVNILYLSPIMKSQSNHRYDTGDYEVVDPYAGTNEELKKLCYKAHKYDIKVILDAVFNHTGNDSKYFNEFGTYPTLGAYQSEKSPYYSFYKRLWRNGRREFSYWWGMKNLPNCDGNSPEWNEYILAPGGVIDKWFNLGIDGLRLDVADELTDNFIEGIKKAVKRNKPDGLIIGEVWKNPMRMNRSYISSGIGMHSVMNYLLVDSLIRYYKYADVWKLESCLKEISSEYPTSTIFTLMNFTSTHDISRAIEIFGCNCFVEHGEWAWNLLDDSVDWIKSHQMTKIEYEYGKQRLKSYIFALTFLPGILSIFYGDEVGMQGIGNLANRGTYPWNNRDTNLLEFFRRMGKVRGQETFLKIANFRIVSIDEKKFVFERYNNKEKIIVFVSRTHHYAEINLPQEYKKAKMVENIESDRKTLAPYGAIALKVEM